MRSFLVILGCTLFFIASLLLIAKPPHQLPVGLPILTAYHNVPYFFYLRAVQWLCGYHAGSVMIANGALMLAIALLVFRLGSGLAEERYALLGGSVALILFQLNPLVIVLPLTLGFLGGYLFVPLFLLLFLNAMRMVDHWSTFMRAIVLAVVWSLFLWVHLPTAVLVLVAMVPWVLYHRRPATALGIFLTVLLLGTALFLLTWTAGCLITHRWELILSPGVIAQALWGYLQQGVATGWSSGSERIVERFIHVTGWMSPFLLVFGIWTSGKVLIGMYRERRATMVDLTALISFLVLGIILVTPGKHTLPGAWYMLMVLGLWTPLIVRNLAKKESFYSRGFRWTVLAGFLVCAVALWVFEQQASTAWIVPDESVLLKLISVLVITGGLVHVLLKKHPLTLENRVQALMLGATAAYYLILDGMLLR